MSFSGDVRQWTEAEKVRLDQQVRAITFKLFSGIVLLTPVAVDFGGRARGNWQTSVGSPQAGDIERLDPSGGSALAEILANMAGIGSINWLTNNLPYIEVLEYGLYPNPPKNPTGKTIGGYSTQAPAGMVRITMARVSEILKEAGVT